MQTGRTTSRLDAPASTVLEKSDNPQNPNSKTIPRPQQSPFMLSRKLIAFSTIPNQSAVTSTFIQACSNNGNRAQQQIISIKMSWLRNFFPGFRSLMSSTSPKMKKAIPPVSDALRKKGKLCISTGSFPCLKLSSPAKSTQLAAIAVRPPAIETGSWWILRGPGLSTSSQSEPIFTQKRKVSRAMTQGISASNNKDNNIRSMK